MENGQARAVIVTGLGGSSAASTLRTVIQQMTGVNLVTLSEDNFDGQGTAIFIGQTDTARQMGIEVEQRYWAGDRYVIRSENTSFSKKIVIVGNDDSQLTSTMYAAYDLLQRMGCGWYGPSTLWHVIPQKATLSVPPVNVDERPAFLGRNIWGAQGVEARYAWRLGGIEMPANHNLGNLVPSNQYPQYYDGHGQPCLASPEVLDIVVRQFRQDLENFRGEAKTFSLSANDNDDFHNCPACLAIGNESAQLLNFANNVARELAKTHPNRFRLNFLAYWPTTWAPSPMIQAEPGVDVMFVNSGNHVQPLDKPDPYNDGIRSRMSGWKQTTGLSGIYEWWIPAVSDPKWEYIPWYSGETALRNLRYWHQQGVRFLLYEAWNPAGGYPERWPLYYVGARGLWDLKITGDQVMLEACDKLYGPASAHMFAFYHTLEKAMMDSNLRRGAWYLPSPQLIYTVQVAAKATEHLEAAAHVAATSQDAAILQRIEQERQMWDTATQLMDQLR